MKTESAQASRNLYYILSRLDRYKNDKYLTFYAHNGAGYQWYKHWVGLYKREGIDWMLNDPNRETYAIESYSIEDMWIPEFIEGRWRLVIHNTKENLKKIKKHRLIY